MEKIAPVRSARCVDPGWQHGVAQDSQKKKVKCNYCGKIVSGGIFRLKQHLAKISGEVTHCQSAPDQVCLNMSKILEGFRSNRKRRPCEYDPETLTSLSVVCDDSTKAPIAYELADKRVGGNVNTTVKSPPHRALRFFNKYRAGVSPRAADSPYSKRMLVLVGLYGEGLKVHQIAEYALAKGDFGADWAEYPNRAGPSMERVAP
ncbi:hypothetical protein MLD38_003506 [Melastoma candidum]|uniref:Uncharacterized protein n=1 Tax=Melastoma candidum TaxID=119954 RepID=A0ACB9S2X6_9MYRT|nr:hypothetical protein MLD38_003506 [Melastoma candidum]